MPYIANRKVKLSGREYAPGAVLPPIEREVIRTLLSCGLIQFQQEGEPETVKAHGRRKAAEKAVAAAA